MKIKASGRSALIIAAGIWACFWGPLQVSETAAKANADVARAAAAKENNAATDAALKKVAKKRQAKKIAIARLHKPAASEPKASTEIKPPQPDIADRSEDPTALPPSVANANAQLAAADIASGDGLLAKADKAKLAAKQDAANNPAAADIVAPDELNDLDLAASNDSPKVIAATLTDVSAASSPDDSLGRTSLIGKIFIAFGGLLTLASAARMFMA
jgi:Flp pilus assembly protein TadG